MSLEINRESRSGLDYSAGDPVSDEREGESLLKTQHLPFTVRAVSEADELARAVGLRADAYGRHLPQFAGNLKGAEPADAADDAVVLLAQSKLDGAALATMRVHFNRVRPLPLEQSVQLPEELRGCSLAEAVRLGIVAGPEGRLPRDMLFKCFYKLCVATKIDVMVICARHPLHKLYQSLAFDDVFASGAFIPMTHIGDIPHRVMALRVGDVEPIWRKRAHPLYDFFFRTFHPDIVPVRESTFALS